MSEEKLDNYKKNIPNHPYIKWDDLKPLYLKERTPSHHLRSYTYDRLYALSDDAQAMTMGIYIIDDRDYKPLTADIKYKNFNETQQKYVHSVHGYKLLQKRNLLNVEVAESILPGHFLNIRSSEFTQILHYKRLTLSRILNFFEKLGYDHVNIIDESCRNEILKPEIRRSKSEKEKEDYADVVKKHNIGGNPSFF